MDINYIVVQTFPERDNRTEIIEFGLHIRGNTIAVEMGIEEMFKLNFWKAFEWLWKRKMPREWYEPLQCYCVAYYKFRCKLFKHQAANYIMSDISWDNN